MRSEGWSLFENKSDRTDENASRVRRDPALAPQVGPEGAGPPPVGERETKTSADLRLRRFEVREPRWPLGEGGPRQLAVSPDPERHPVLIDLHEDDRSRLLSAGREVLEDRKAGGVVCARDLVP